MIGFIIGSIVGGSFASIMTAVLISAGHADKKLEKTKNKFVNGKLSEKGA